MTKELMENVNFPIRQGLKLKVVSYTSHSPLFLGLCEDVKVSIRELKIRHPIFVIEAEDHNLVLGQLFLKSVKFSHEYTLDGIFGTITHFYTH